MPEYFMPNLVKCDIKWYMKHFNKFSFHIYYEKTRCASIERKRDGMVEICAKCVC